MLSTKAIEQKDKYVGYSYSYPHKLAYRTFDAVEVKDLWKEENKENLFFYLHIPFCEMRCGFCNLFTIANPKEGVQAYVNKVIEEIDFYQSFLPHSSFTNFAIGGGTPTFLEVEELALLFNKMKSLGISPQTYYGSIEASPKTLTADKLALINEFGISRLSMGIQSWHEEEVKALGRPQTIATTQEAVELLAQSSIQEFNLDLIYGGQHQTIDSFLFSIQKTIDYHPTEIFLYPLYVRELTGLGKKKTNEYNDRRSELYLAGRDALLAAGYEQVSMRCFRKANTKTKTLLQHNACTDNMVGVGAGARSYTKGLHYSSDYAVDRKEIKSIISNYSARESFHSINYGVYLNDEEQKRRFLIKGITDGGTLSSIAYQHRFGTNAFEEFEFMKQLIEKKWLIKKGDNYVLSAEGMCYEDFIGPSLYSSQVKILMETSFLK